MAVDVIIATKLVTTTDLDPECLPLKGQGENVKAERGPVDLTRFTVAPRRVAARRGLGPRNLMQSVYEDARGCQQIRHSVQGVAFTGKMV